MPRFSPCSFPFRTTLRVLALVLLTALVWTAAGCDSSHPGDPHDPDTAPLVTADIDRFWAAMDASTPQNRAEVLQSMYLDPGSPGLDAFVQRRIDNADKLAAAVNRLEPYYRSTRPEMARIREMEPAIRASYRALQDRYPDAVFPPVYFLVGRASTGGTIDDAGLLISTEIFARPDDAPVDNLSPWLREVTRPIEDLPAIVAHELVHVQQQHPYDGRLLAAAIQEGAADFIGEIISGQTTTPSVHAWAAPREAEVWADFQDEMYGTTLRGWLYDGDGAPEGRPADLGYWMGYQIVASFYERAADKDDAIRHILTIDDFDRFLEESGYRPSPAVASP